MGRPDDWTAGAANLADSPDKFWDAVGIQASLFYEFRLKSG